MERQRKQGLQRRPEETGAADPEPNVGRERRGRSVERRWQGDGTRGGRMQVGWEKERGVGRREREHREGWTS